MSLYPGHFVPGTGRFRTIIGTDPAAGANIAETVPANTIWRLISLHVNFVTDANVASRQLVWVLDNGANIFYYSPASSTQAASLTRRYTLSNNSETKGTIAIYFWNPIPHLLYLPPAYVIRTQVSAIQVGDDFDAPIIHVEEWLTNDF